MRGFRRLFASIVAAVFLLGFTAYDLGTDVFAFPGCESDLQTGPWTPASPNQSGSGESSSEVHLDDCFCCSHCVRPSVSFFLTEVSNIEQFEFIQRWTLPWVAPGEFFRPPKLA